MTASLKIKLSPITHPFQKPTFACLASFFVTNNLFLSLTFQVFRGKGYKGMLSTVLGFPGGRVITPFWHRRPLVFPKGCFHQKLQAILMQCLTASYVLLDYIFFFFCLVICCRTKMTRLILKVVVYPSIFEKKRTKNWSKPL